MKKVHFYPWNGGTEADSDMPEHVFCGNEAIMEDYQLANAAAYVTCKRCLKLLGLNKTTAVTTEKEF